MPTLTRSGYGLPSAEAEGGPWAMEAVVLAACVGLWSPDHAVVLAGPADEQWYGAFVQR